MRTPAQVSGSRTHVAFLWLGRWRESARLGTIVSRSRREAWVTVAARWPQAPTVLLRLTAAAPADLLARALALDGDAM